MIRTTDELAAFIRFRLTTHSPCRVFCHVLDHCWSLPRPEQTAQIRTFAATYGWEVQIHTPAAYGVVADFEHPATMDRTSQ